MPDLVTGAASLVLVALVAAAAIPAGEQLPLGSSRWILPRAATPVPAESEHLLLTVVGLRNGPDDLLFTADTSAPVPRWRLTVLDDYGGQGWSSTQRFRPAASRLPVAPDGNPRSGSEADQQIELNVPEGSEEPVWGRWLPAADGVVATSLEGLLFDADTGTLLAPEGELPQRYDATSAVGPADDGLRTNARAATDAEADATSRLPEPDGSFDDLDGLVELADEITAEATSDYDRAVSIQRHLLGNGELLVDEDAPSGHALRHIHDFLLGRDEAGDDAGNEAGGGVIYGTAEQFATAFVVLARAAELPTRVVVGFEGSGTTGPQEVTAHDASAWVEVRFHELGWIPFDAVPDPTSDVLPPEPQSPSPDGSEDDAESAGDTGESEAGDATGEDQVPEGDGAGEGDDGRTGSSDGDDERTTTAPPSRTVPEPAALALTFALLGVALLGAPALRRALRRRRRRHVPGPAGQVAGAWAAVVDDLQASGLTVRRTMAVTELTRVAAGQLPARAEQIFRTWFARQQVRVRRRTSREDNAARAWDLSSSIVKTRRADRSWRPRLREYFTW